jgi:transposase
LLAPLAHTIGPYVRSGQAIFADDTSIKMQAKSKCATARIWTYVRDERPWASEAPPAVWYQFSADREGKQPADHLIRYQGWMPADGYSGFNELYEKGRIKEVAYMTHVRRKFVDIFKNSGLEIAEEAIKRIALLYAVEKTVRGKSLKERAMIRQERAKPVFNELEN